MPFYVAHLYPESADQLVSLMHLLFSLLTDFAE